MRILITGAEGFIGGHLCLRLTGLGHEVFRVVRPGDNLNKPRREDTLPLDLRESDALEAHAELKPVTVVHLAAVLPPRLTGSEAIDAALINKIIDRNVFLMSRKWGAHVVYSSGSSVYGLDGGDIKTESSPVSPLGPYATQKFVSEQLGEELLSGQGVPFTSLRISAPYGQGQRARTVMNLFVDRALRSLPLHYYGTGSRQQDFTHIEDLVDAVCKIVKLRRGGVYNIAGGRPVSMLQLAELVVRSVPACESSISAAGEPDAQEGATALYSIEKAKVELDWQPRVALEAGIQALALSRKEDANENRVPL